MNLAPLQPFPANITSEPTTSLARNFLFLSPTKCDTTCGDQCVHKKFAAAASGMREDGFVYIAEAGRKLVEDDALGVRHLPFDRSQLPSFGSLAAVVVLNEKELIESAHQQYPGARLYLFEAPSEMVQ